MVRQKNRSTDNQYLPKKYKITHFVRETPAVFTITIDAKMNHEPGQFVQVTLPGIGEAPISICSHSDKYIKLNIREIGNVTDKLAKLKKGDSIFVRGPYGKGFPMKTLSGNNLILIGGGCGVAPLRGIIEYVEQHRKDFADITFFLGYRTDNDIIFKRDLDRWNSKYKIEVTIDEGAHTHFCYDTKGGFITDALKVSSITNSNCVVFLCGPPLMMKYSVEILKQKGFHDDQLFISAERLMYCGIGICCHCMIHGKFTCTDGPVFRYDEIKDYVND